ncbi:plasminogen-binding N-terminal domain-containing protein [Nitratifractor sp.]
MKRWILFFALSAFVAAGIFPGTVRTVVTAVSGSEATLKRPFPLNGMSGIVIHDFGKGRQAITAVVVQERPGTVRVIGRTLLPHRGLPSPKHTIAPGDRVIGGYLYSNILVIAPNAATYNAIAQGGGKFWIHPDLYAAFLAREGESHPTPDNLAAFARDAQVGLVALVGKDRLVLFDPISSRVIKRVPFHPKGNGAKSPFYSRFSSIPGGLFSGSGGNYYETIGAFR